MSLPPPSMEANKSPAELTLDCLTKIGKDDRRVPIFFLENTTITIGRDYSNSISINSNDVSRNHAVLQKLDNQWQVKDSSTNGVFINNNRITKQSFYKLVRGDAISLGPPQNSLFKFVLNSHDALSLPEIYFQVPCKITPNGLVINIQSDSEDKSQLDLLKEYKEQFQTLVIEEKNNNIGDHVKETPVIANPNPNPKSPLMDSSKELELKLDKTMTQNKKLASEKEELLKQVKILREKLKVETGNQVTLTQKVDQLETELSKLEDAKEETRLILLKKNDRLRKEMNEVELRAKHDVAEALNAQLTMQKDFESEKLSLLQQIEDLQTKLDTKDSQADLLRSELCAIHMNNEQNLFDAHRQVVDLMEAELVCSICSELFVETTTLSCKHSFCQYCINSWERGRQGCPICRAPIGAKVGCINIDNFISNMVLNFKPEEKKRREEVVRSRQQP